MLVFMNTTIKRSKCDGKDLFSVFIRFQSCHSKVDFALTETTIHGNTSHGHSQPV